MSCVIIHNYVIDLINIFDDVGDKNVVEARESDFTIHDVPSGMSYLPNIPKDFEERVGESQTRTAIVQNIRRQRGPPEAAAYIVTWEDLQVVTKLITPVMTRTHLTSWMRLPMKTLRTPITNMWHHPTTQQEFIQNLPMIQI
jgi:hypothetical protein